MNLGNVNRPKRWQAGFKQMVLADFMSVNKCAVAHWESGRYPSAYNKLFQLCVVLDVREKFAGFDSDANSGRIIHDVHELALLEFGRDLRNDQRKLMSRFFGSDELSGNA